MQNTLQQIVTQLENQNFSRVIELCQQALRLNNHPQVHLFLGIALGEQKQIKQAIEIFSKLIAHFPQNPDIYYNFAIVLAKNDLEDDAIKNYQMCLSKNPSHASAWNNIGEIYLSKKQYNEAILNFRKACELAPNNIHYLRSLSFSYYYYKDKTNAKLSFQLFVHSEFCEANDMVVYLEILMSMQNYSDVVSKGTSALLRFHENAEILNIIGLCYLEQRETINAIDYLQRSYSKNPDIPETSYNLALAYSLHGDETKLEQLLNKILSVKHIDSFVFVASIYEKNNRLDKTLNLIENGLNIYPNNSELLYLRSKSHKQLKQYNKALDDISTAIDNHQGSIEPKFIHEKAQLLEKIKSYDEAWNTSTEANDVALNSWNQSNPAPDKYIGICNEMAMGEILNGQTMTNLSKEGYGKNLIFIFGFPRSGTTLLDSILSAHSATTILEELPIIKETFNLISNDAPSNYFKQVQQLSEVQKNELRKHYYNSVKNHINWNGDGILIDKSPLNSSLVAFINAIFPDAKIIFSVRHPLDVCISCFFQEFNANSFMTNMTRIQKVAKTYSAMLNVWSKSVEHFNINVYYQHYEKLVNHFESEIRSLVSYLELPWEDDMLTFQDSLKNRGTITNPSYNQVNQPIYQTAKNRYKNYLPYLAEASEILKPWIEKFKYSNSKS